MPITLAKLPYYLITSGKATIENFSKESARIISLAKRAATAEFALMQIREKNLPAKLLFELTRKCAAITGNSPTKLLVNDRADIAVAAGADGVHLTTASLPADVIRKQFGDDLLIGVSCHSADEIIAAQDQGADFALFGPVFRTPEKEPYGPPQGLTLLTGATQSVVGFPVFAVGGIDELNYADALSAGAAGVAAIRWLNEKLESGEF
jgi:thiamine-phosphate pyrophosphorylase